MLTCLTLPLLGLGVLFFSWIGKRTTGISIDTHPVRTDLGFFMTCYGIALLMALLPFGESGRWINYTASVILVGLYLLYLRRVLMKEGPIGDDLEPLILSRGLAQNNDTPHTALILTQVALGFGLIIGGAPFFV